MQALVNVSLHTKFQVPIFTLCKDMMGSQNLIRISWRWETRAMRCITANVLQTSKVDAQCDKLATEVSWQCLASTVASLQLLHLHLTYLTCIWRLRLGNLFEFCRDFQRQETRVTRLSCGFVCVILRLAVSVEHWLVTDGWTDRHTTTADTRAGPR